MLQQMQGFAGSAALCCRDMYMALVQNAGPGGNPSAIYSKYAPTEGRSFFTRKMNRAQLYFQAALNADPVGANSAFNLAAGVRETVANSSSDAEVARAVDQCIKLGM